MKKRILPLALALLLCLGLMPPALAAGSGFEIKNGVLTEYTGPGGNVTIPSSVTKIGLGAFEDCTSLTSVTIPSSVTSIGDWAFRDCTSLTSVTIQGIGTEFDPVYEFSGCTNLTDLKIPENHCQYLSVDDVLFEASESVLVFCPQGKQGEYIIPEGVTEIGGRAFRDCTSLTSVTIPDSVTEIGWSAFEGCTSLTKVKMPIGLWLQSTWPTPYSYILGIGDVMSGFLDGEFRPFHVRDYSFDHTPFGTRHVVIQMTVFFLLVAVAIGIPLYRRKVAIRKDPEGYARKKQEKQERKAAKKEAKKAEQAAANATAQARRRTEAVISGTVTCSCGTVNPATAKFCSGCGKPVKVPGRCECGHQNDPAAKFCQKCGKPLDGGEG